MNFLPSSRWSVRLVPIIATLLMLIALTSQRWLPYDSQATDLPSRLLSPDAQHWLGTNHLGRDIFLWLMAAARMPLGSVTTCLLLVLVLGLITGDSARLIGEHVSQVTMHVADVFMTFLTSILSLFVVGAFGTRLTNVIIAITPSHWARYACMMRSLVTSLRQREFVLASRLSDAGHVRAFINHLAGAVTPSLLMLVTLDIGHTMLHIAGMSFLGPGVIAPTAEWGVTINDARQYIWAQPLQIFWPGLTLSVSMMAPNLVGDALYDHLDPHLVTEHTR